MIVRHLRRLFQLSLVCAMLVPGTPGGARACSIRACPDTYGAPAPGSTIPANAPALFVRRGDGPDDDGNGPITLTTANDDPLPFAAVDDPANPPGGRLLLLAQPLPQGAVRVRTNVCGESSGFSIDNTFTAGAPSPLPTRFGAVVVSGPKPIAATTGLCTFNGLVQPTGVSLSFETTPAATAYAALTQLTLTVDGELWAKERYGRDPPSASPTDERKVDLIFTECGAVGNPAARPGIAPGFHHAAVSAHIAGVDSDLPAVEFDFELTCPPPLDGGATAGAALGDVDAGVSLDGAADHLVSLSPAGGGCRVGADAAPDARAGVALVLLAMLGAHSGRRYRRRRHRP